MKCEEDISGFCREKVSSNKVFNNKICDKCCIYCEEICSEACLVFLDYYKGVR